MGVPTDSMKYEEWRSNLSASLKESYRNGRKPVTPFVEGHSYGKRFQKGHVPANKGITKRGKCLNCDRMVNEPKNKYCSRDCYFGSTSAWNKGKKTGYLTHTKSTIKKMLKRNGKSSLEKKFQEVVDNLQLPYKFVGDGQVLIGRKCPDFVNTNGKKIAVDVFYRKHKERFRNGGLEQWKIQRKQIFQDFGWELIYFDETQVCEKNIKRCLL